eukprot:3409298-Lingulodinium_polyedra.AAC.1
MSPSVAAVRPPRSPFSRRLRLRRASSRGSRGRGARQRRRGPSSEPLKRSFLVAVRCVAATLLHRPHRERRWARAHGK